MSTQPPTTCLSMPLLAIQATRAAMSPSGLETGRVGFAPANENASESSCSMSRTEGNRFASARIASMSEGGTRWAWLSMIKRYPPSAPTGLGIGDGIADGGNAHGQRVEPDIQMAHGVIDRP